MSSESSEQAATFIRAVFGQSTEQPVFITSLANERDDPHEPPPRQVGTRDLADIGKFIKKWDRPRRGLFFCVGTLAAGAKREKANIQELPGLWADVDFKHLACQPAEAEQAIKGLRHPPSLVVRSGNGLHCYWLFKEAVPGSEQERVEQALRQLCDIVGGDTQVCEIARLMRLPGSHNTKEGAWLPVEISQDDNGLRYELDDLEEWLAEQSPVLKRRPVEGQQSVETNPFLAIAAQLGFKPPVDVEQRLAQMSYGGAGDASIHATQLAVSASLLNKGRDPDEVVQILLNATKAAAGAHGEKWNWRSEERAIQKMCDGWRAKHPQAAPRPAAAAQQQAPKDNVVQLAHARKPKPAKGDVPLHIVIGQATIAAIKQRGDDLMFMQKAAWRYVGGIWSMEVDGLKSWLDVEIETACRGLSLESTNRLVSEARNWISRNPDLWREEVAWDSHGCIPTLSGLVDPHTLILTPLRADHYCTWTVATHYDPTAGCPWWQTMVADTFADREPDVAAGVVSVVQELLGAALLDTKPRALSKALILQGGSNFGKSGLLEVLGGLFGTEQIATGLEALEGSHGLMSFTRRLPWVLHEAFDQSKWHFSSVVKAIITGEPVAINIKNGPMLSARVRAPIFWGTNHPPQFKEATKAIVNRIVIIECRREFAEGRPVGAALEARRHGFDKPSSLVLEIELPGLLNWAISGLQRALARGYIELTEEMQIAGEEMRRDSNLVAGFIEECIEYNHDMRVSVPDFCAAFAVWWLESKGEDRRTPSNEAVSKALKALSNPRIAQDSKLRDNTRRYYACIALNERGRLLWRRALESRAFEGKTVSTTSQDGQVNTPVPTSWGDNPAVLVARMYPVFGVTEAGDSSKSKNVTVTRGASSTVTRETVTDELSSTETPDTSQEPRF